LALITKKVLRFYRDRKTTSERRKDIIENTGEEGTLEARKNTSLEKKTHV